MSNQIQIKRGLSSALSSAGVIAGELKYTTDTKRLYVGTGTENECLNNIIQPVTSLPTTGVTENGFYYLSVASGSYPVGIYYATINAGAVTWHSAGGVQSVSWEDIQGSNPLDNTALFTLLGNVEFASLTATNLTGAVNELKTIVDGMSSGITYKGVVATRADLPDDASNGDLYFITNESNKGVIYNSSTGEWDDFGSTIDISGKVDKTQTIATLPLSGNISASELKNALGITSSLKYKGAVATVSDLPSTADVGDCYYVQSVSGSSTGAMYCWNGTEWQSLGSLVDVSTLQPKVDSGITVPSVSGNVVSAINKTYTDAAGNIIKFVYDSDEYTLKAQLYKSDSTTLISETSTIDLPLEQLVVSIEYVDTTEHPKSLKITLKNGEVSYVPVSGLVSGLVTLSTEQTITNKTIDADDNTIQDLTTSNLKTGVLQTSIRESSSASDTALASEKAIRTQLDTKLSAAAGSTNADKFLITDSSGNVIYSTFPDWAIIDGGTF